jgi:ribosome biogenesis protein NSA1
MTPVQKDNNDSRPLLAAIPTHLRDWRLSPDQETFAYGGDEVDLSVWNTELAFSPRSEHPASTTVTSAKKQKRDSALLPGELWRAKNVRSKFCSVFFL